MFPVEKGEEYDKKQFKILNEEEFLNEAHRYED